MPGTVNIARDLWDDPTFKHEEMSQREAWIWLIAKASWKPRTTRSGDYIVGLQRGQLAASTRFLAEAWMWSEARVRRYLAKLEDQRRISRDTDTGVTVVTLCNYDIYQTVPNIQPILAFQYRVVSWLISMPRSSSRSSTSRKRQREADVERHRQANDLGAGLEVAKRGVTADLWVS